MHANERRTRATDEASCWWHKLGTQTPADVSEEDRQQFTQWLRESPLHVAELLHVAHVHDALERFKLWGEVSADEAVDNTVVALDSVGLRRQCAASSNTGIKWMGAIAATIAAVAVIAGAVVMQVRGQLVATDRAERREVMLNDGSVVRLEPETTLRINLRKHERRISLDGGRALFNVAKDRSRPFFVEIDNTLVRAVGTAFGVERNDGGIVVTVSEGKVAVGDVSPAGGGLQVKASSSEMLLTAGKQLTVGYAGLADSVRDVDTTRALAWAEGRLVFDSAPLSEAAREFNRYNHVQLEIEDAELARRPISGVFQASDLETFIAFVRAGARVSVAPRGRDRIVISPSR